MLDVSPLVFSVPTVCLYINKQADAGPYLERRKLQQLPERLGPERPAAVLQQAVQACIDCAHQPRLVFSLVKQGYRGELVSGKVWGVGGMPVVSLQPSPIGDSVCLGLVFYLLGSRSSVNL